jgi:hypothetical protein
MKESLRKPLHLQVYPSPPFRGEREGPAPKGWEGEVGLCEVSGIRHLTSTLSAPRAPKGGEGAVWRPSYCLAVAFLAGLSLWGPAGAAEPNAVGIIMKVTGETDPGLPLREEVSANTVIKLGPGAELTFLHYPPTCELVTVAGGTLKLTKTAFTTDGEVKNQQNRPCPRVYNLSGTGGGWVARDLLRLPVAPEIIFAGSRAGEVTEAAVYEKGEPDRLLYLLELADQRATAPVSAAPLETNHRYVLKLRISDTAQPLEHGFIAVGAGATESLVVLHVE